MMLDKPKTNPELPVKDWKAQWITYSIAEGKAYGVYHFRKSFHLDSVPVAFTIQISADNHYCLFVNGKFVSDGPATGSLENWFYDTIDISVYLHQGKNTLAVSVWNMAEYRSRAQFSIQSALIIEGACSVSEVVNTGEGWKVKQNLAYTPCSLNTSARLNAYMAIGPGDEVNGTKYPWEWETLNYNDRTWQGATILNHKAGEKWKLSHSNLPPMFNHPQRFGSIRRTFGIQVNPAFLIGKQPVIINANMEVSILLDMEVNTVAYPEIILSKGYGSSIKLTYAETLMDEYGRKGNRNEIDGKHIYGNYDIFHTDGGGDRKFKPLWFRAFRYLQIDIVTSDQSLIINDIYSVNTGYPLINNASFICDDPSLKKIWDIGWRTARLCARDVYYDTPYYEQLQYVADSRIQALITMYNSGDDRLIKKTIMDFYHSRIPEGLTQSRYPSIKLQVIPAFSLFWISMVHDYWMHCLDNDFISLMLPLIKDILNWFEAKIAVTGMLGPLTWWNFVDWDNFDGMGRAPGWQDGNSAILTLHYSYTLNIAADLFTAFDLEETAFSYRALSAKLNQATFKKCYHTILELVADTPSQQSFSQHTGIWAILSDAIPAPDRKPMMKRLLTNKNLAQVTYFYRFYLCQALKKAGMADQYYSELTPWREMVALGLTTFAEKPEPTRSDCHGWSASPNYDFLATICGIMPLSAGFKKILIKPALGELKEVSATMPHPEGAISVHLKRIGTNGMSALINLPNNTEGQFIWNNRKIFLYEGRQKIYLPTTSF